MSEQNAEEDKTGEAPQPRDKQGRFDKKTQSDTTVQSQPTDSEYTKINSRLAKQLGISDKLADYQTQYNPKDLYKMLDFMADNTESKVGKQSNTLPENQPIAPISPQPNKYELPGTQLSKPNLTQENFAVHFKIEPKDLFQPKDKK